MHAALMTRPARVATIGALVLAVGAALAFALLSGGTRTAQAAVRHSTKHATHHATHHARHARHAARTTADPTGAPDGDNVQSGDQTTPDPTSAAAPGETSGESSVETEQGQPGEPANGHQDPAGSAGSQCDGNCVQ